MVSLKIKNESLIKYYIKVTCALKWARKLPRKTETYESAKCVPCNTRKCTHNGFVSDLLKWALKCRFYATGPWAFSSAVSGFCQVFFSRLRPSANTENFRRTREKPLVPRVADTHGKRKRFPLLHGAGRHYNGSQKWPLEWKGYVPANDGLHNYK